MKRLPFIRIRKRGNKIIVDGHVILRPRRLLIWLTLVVLVATLLLTSLGQRNLDFPLELLLKIMGALLT